MSMLLAEDAGVAAHASAAARGSIQKQFALTGLSAYYRPGTAAAAGPDAAAPLHHEAGRHGRVHGASSSSSTRSSEDGTRPDPHTVLHPTKILIHLTSQPAAAALAAAGKAGPGGGARVHAAALVHSMRVSLRPDQLADALLLADRVAWTAAQNRHAAFRSPGWRRPGAGAASAPRRLWQFAISAVVSELRGAGGADGTPWRPAAALAHMRRRYMMLYRKKLERRRQEQQQRASGGAAASDLVS